MGMILNKYQYREADVKRRGYSESARVLDGTGTEYWAKWILGVDKDDDRTSAYSDGVRRLQRAEHASLPPILDFGWDDERGAFVVIYHYLNKADPLENRVRLLSESVLIAGLKDIAECLAHLHAKHQITHGDVHPGNILVDEAGQFHLIDLGLARLTQTLSQEAAIEIFRSAFAAPELLDSKVRRGHPFQSDVYAFAKTIEWVGKKWTLEWNENAKALLARMQSSDPAERPLWPQVLKDYRLFGEVLSQQTVGISFKGALDLDLMRLMAEEPPRIKVGTKAGPNIILDMLVRGSRYEGVLWLIEDRRLLVGDRSPSDPSKDQGFRPLPGKYRFDSAGQSDQVDLTPLLRKWQQEAQAQRSLREKQKHLKSRLGFYKELIEKELEVIEKGAFRIKYSEVRRNGQDVEFKVVRGEGFDETILHRHLREANAPDAEAFQYVASVQGDPRDRDRNCDFNGRPYEYDRQHGWLSITDSEGLKMDRIPRKGVLMENTRMKRTEKERQRNAVKDVEMGDVQSPQLIEALFNPGELPAIPVDDAAQLEEVWQKGSDGAPFTYSRNQRKAIRQALDVKPLSVIQGPPGTGKTTVITEVVFQLLHTRPGTKILITSQTNNAVDQVLENLDKNGIPFLRLKGAASGGSKAMNAHTPENKVVGWGRSVQKRAKREHERVSAEMMKTISAQHPLARTVLEILLNPDSKNIRRDLARVGERVKGLEPLRDLPEEKSNMVDVLGRMMKADFPRALALQELHKEWINTLETLDPKGTVANRIVDTIRVIGATCNHVAATKYRSYNFNFDYIIMDESGKATMAEALVPITMGQNLVYVGDHRQLKPMLTASRDVEKWLREKFKHEADELESWDDYFNRPSLFEDVIDSIPLDYKTQLVDCRRSSKEQVERTSRYFYEAKGDEPIKPVERPADKEHPLSLAAKTSIVFVDIGSEHRHEADKRSRSSKNTRSAQAVVEVLDSIDKQDVVKECTVGVIVPYSAQWELLRTKLSRERRKAFKNLGYKPNSDTERFRLSVIDRFQGLEADIVIMDFVKSGPELDLGFLKVPNRINVALSRQKMLLIMIGDYKGLMNARPGPSQNKHLAIQAYLESLEPEWVVPMADIKTFFA